MPSLIYVYKHVSVMGNTQDNDWNTTFLGGVNLHLYFYALYLVVLNKSFQPHVKLVKYYC